MLFACLFTLCSPPIKMIYFNMIIYQFSTSNANWDIILSVLFDDSTLFQSKPYIFYDTFFFTHFFLCLILREFICNSTIAHVDRKAVNICTSPIKIMTAWDRNANNRTNEQVNEITKKNKRNKWKMCGNDWVDEDVKTKCLNNYLNIL